MNNIKVQGFQGLKSLELLGLEKVNILVGDNNSGKTTLLGAISIAFPAGSEAESISFLRTIEKDEKEEILEMLRLFDNNIIDIEILSTRKIRTAIKIRHQTLGLAPLYVFGQGINRALMMAIALMSNENGVLLIDEIERSIYLSTIDRVFSWLVRNCEIRSIQLFITTHSLEVVDAMLAAMTDLDNLACFTLSKERLPPRRLDGEMLHRLRFDRGLDVR